MDVRKLIGQALPAGSPDSHAALAESARIRKFSRNETIVRQGEPVLLALVATGHIAFRRTTVDGQQLIIGLVRSGEMIGFSSIASTYASVELVGLTDGCAALWPGHEVRNLAAADPGLALNAIDRLADSVNAIIERMDGFLYQDARRRVARILARHRDLFFSEPAVLTRSDLPSLVGTSREMTGRVLRDLEREGMVARVGRNGLRLLRPELLDVSSPPPAAGADG